MGVPSSWCRGATFAFAAAERAAGATGSRVAPAAWSSSVKSSSRQASFRCHSTVWASMQRKMWARTGHAAGNALSLKRWWIGRTLRSTVFIDQPCGRQYEASVEFRVGTDHG